MAEIAQFLAGNMTDEGLFLYNFLVDEWHPHMEVPWISGMAQGLAIQSFLRAYEVTANSTYLEMADKVINSYSIDYQAGGFTFYNEDNTTWLLEAPSYPEENVKFILNGHLFSIFGLWEYLNHPEINNSTSAYIMASNMFDSSINATINHIDYYSMEFSLSRYSRKDLVIWDYLFVHVNQLEILTRMNISDVFGYYYQLWKPSYYTNSDWSPEVTNFSAHNISAGILLKWQINKPVRVLVEYGEAGHQKTAYINYTLSTSGEYLIQAPRAGSQVYYRIWFSDEYNITKLHPKVFSVNYSCVWEQNFNSDFDSNYQITITSRTSSSSVDILWETEVETRVTLEFGVAGWQTIRYENYTYALSGNYSYFGVINGHEYYYRLLFITRNQSYSLIPTYFNTDYSIIWNQTDKTFDSFTKVTTINENTSVSESSSQTADFPYSNLILAIILLRKLLFTYLKRRNRF